MHALRQDPTWTQDGLKCDHYRRYTASSSEPIFHGQQPEICTKRFLDILEPDADKQLKWNLDGYQLKFRMPDLYGYFFLETPLKWLLFFSSLCSFSDNLRAPVGTEHGHDIDGKQFDACSTTFHTTICLGNNCNALSGAVVCHSDVTPVSR